MNTYIFFTLAAGFLIITMCIGNIDHTIRLLLKEKYFNEWVKLGSVDNYNYSIDSFFLLIFYLRHKDYLNLKDKIITKKCILLSFLFPLLFVYLISMFVVLHYLW